MSAEVHKPTTRSIKYSLIKKIVREKLHRLFFGEKTINDIYSANLIVCCI